MSKSLKQMAYDTIEAHQETIADLRTQLAKAEEDCKTLFSAFESCQDELKESNERESVLSCQLDSHIERVAELERDKERLDLLDECNAEFNSRCGSNYGWKVDWNHNRIALVDTGIPKTDVRTALDDFSSRAQLRKEQE